MKIAHNRVSGLFGLSGFILNLRNCCLLLFVPVGGLSGCKLERLNKLKRQERRFTFSSSIPTFILWLIIIISIPFAQELNFTASVDQTTVGLDESFTLNVTVSGENMGSIPQPELPSLPDFNVLGQSQSQSTNISFINGKMTTQNTIDFIYTLAPKKIGKSTIGPCRLKLKDRTHETQSIEIEVVKGSTAGSNSTSGNQGAPPATTGNDIATGDNLFILCSANRKSVYTGEQINVSYEIYTRYPPSEFGNLGIPNFSGFWVEPIFEAKYYDFKTKTYNGINYNAMLIKSAALFPIAAGDLQIGSMALTFSVIQRSRDFFDIFNTTRSVRIESKPISVRVLPLPEPKPPEFTGGVGKFTINATLDRDSSVSSEPITLKVRISGRGNIRLIEKPKTPEISGLRILDPEVKDDIKINGDAIEGFKEFLFPIIPQTDGKYVIPGITLTFFNPQTKTYETILTSELTFTAVKTSSSAQVNDASGLKVLGTDINYIKPDASRLTPQKSDAPWWLLTIYPLSLVLIGYAFFYRSRRERISTDVSFARLARSDRLVKKRLKLAEAQLKKNQHQEFYCSLSQAIIGYAGDIFNLEAQTLTQDQIRNELLKRKVPAGIVDQLIEIINQCDHARFSPALTTFKDPGELLKRTRETLTKL